MNDLEARIKAAWQGRVSGCMLGKAAEVYSMTAGRSALVEYLERARALPLRDYIPYTDDAPEALFRPSCRGCFDASAPDDDINYSVLALELLEEHGSGQEVLSLDALTARTVAVARAIA